MLALRASDLDRVRELLLDALEAGAGHLALFVDAVRPALHQVCDEWDADEERGLGGETVRGLSRVFGDLIHRVPQGGAGAGRRAVVVGPRAGRELLDTDVLVELLERDGWMVSAISPDRPDAGRLVAQLEPTAVVLAGRAAGEGQTLGRVRAAVGDLQSPPLVVRCLMEPEAQGLPPVLVEVDEGSEDVGIDQVLPRLAQRFSARGMPAWGVAMRRESPENLTVTPSGHLDDDTAARLREVVESRRGSFSSLVLNLAELSGSEQPALGELLRWVADEGWSAPTGAGGG